MICVGQMRRGHLSNKVQVVHQLKISLVFGLLKKKKKAKASINVFFPYPLSYTGKFSVIRLLILRDSQFVCITLPSLFDLTAEHTIFHPLLCITPKTSFCDTCFSHQNVSSVRQRPGLIHHLCFLRMSLSHRGDMQA